MTTTNDVCVCERAHRTDETWAAALASLCLGDIDLLGGGLSERFGETRVTLMHALMVTLPLTNVLGPGMRATHIL